MYIYNVIYTVYMIYYCTYIYIHTNAVDQQKQTCLLFNVSHHCLGVWYWLQRFTCSMWIDENLSYHPKGWTSLYQLFWTFTRVPGFDPYPTHFRQVVDEGYGENLSGNCCTHTAQQFKNTDVVPSKSPPQIKHVYRPSGNQTTLKKIVKSSWKSPIDSCVLS